MTPTWQSDDLPEGPGPLSARAWFRVLRRGVPLGVVVFGCLGLMLLLRVVERPLFGLRRPVTPWITRFVCLSAFVLMGIRRNVRGAPAKGRCVVVANHASWLDIFTLNAGDRVYFVSKAEVAGWPGIGWLARATGTVFINRDRKEAKAHSTLFAERLAAGHRLLFFPEGTSTDGRRVLSFKSTLFQAFFDSDMNSDLSVQPVSVIYRPPAGEDPRFYAWWGDMDFGPHLLKVLAARRQGSVDVIYHASVPVDGARGRKALAAQCEDIVRAGVMDALPPTPGPSSLP
ncbi:lysophospholipid acyltransferase family protein [Tropicimonas isoalkanivorans]|uniref:Lyso-ornithine lipid acyltransferase n=1 Tax=Tropicimonas isoalkanivorans TaxID=441112 RepID=A0A1I1DBF5_9RHOB|nr:lysophospholipid acyltransferase family protein [Tropicimonas isoalkanivorans]SFB71692.1 lyso-ornithine lipid acyltransferase [Tropicimonas isoalkanivorans]